MVSRGPLFPQPVDRAREILLNHITKTASGTVLHCMRITAMTLLSTGRKPLQGIEYGQGRENRPSLFCSFLSCGIYERPAEATARPEMSKRNRNTWQMQ